MSLPAVFASGIAFSALLVGVCFFLFAWQAADRKRWWLANLDQDAYFSVTRNAVTLAAALGVGVTLFFSYRKQQTAEKAQDLAVEAQKMALASQQLATETLQLSLEKHELERTSELRNRYARSAEQLASPQPAIQQAGIHSLASLADDWQKVGNEDDQQVCIALLCAYVSGAAEQLDSPSTSPGESPQTTATGVILSRLSPDVALTAKSWSGKALSLHSAPILTAGDIAVNGGQQVYDHCKWTIGASLIIDSGRIKIKGSVSEKTFPSYIGGEFRGGRATLFLEDGSSGQLVLQRADFLGSTVSLFLVTKSQYRITLRSCVFTSGRLTLRTRTSMIVFERCIFTPEQVVVIYGRLSSSQVKLINCEFLSNDGQKTPYSTEDFIKSVARNLDGKSVLLQQPLLF